MVRPDQGPPATRWVRAPDVMAAEVAALLDGETEPAAVGGGDTARRWLTLCRWAREGSISTARLAEAHLDATAIAAEADHQPGDGLYGVWASAGSEPLRLDGGRSELTGTKPFCSGVGVVGRALVTAVDDAGRLWLCDVAATGPTTESDTSAWRTEALAETHTGSVSFDRHPVDAILGEPGWYLDRPGFWHGAIGPAACWAGAALGLIDFVLDGVLDRDRDRGSGNDHPAAELGALLADANVLHALLLAAGTHSDRHPADAGAARTMALATRHGIERTATAAADRVDQLLGPRPLVADIDHARRRADLALYLRQHHGWRDLVLLAETHGRS